MSKYSNCLGCARHSRSHSDKHSKLIGTINLLQRRLGASQQKPGDINDSQSATDDDDISEPIPEYFPRGQQQQQQTGKFDLNTDDWAPSIDAKVKERSSIFSQF
ncbi:hypothetical protein Ciccas_013955 [Cichlidogyrus casuarinus]|uniref:Uncharacterized protein n=1 Tax=Cichlidogyrus casuarinus TaxID=1844966 RepID=A0ABD2PKF3_9PLAT